MGSEGLSQAHFGKNLKIKLFHFFLKSPDMFPHGSWQGLSKELSMPSDFKLEQSLGHSSSLWTTISAKS